MLFSSDFANNSIVSYFFVKSYQNILSYYHSHTKKYNEFLLIRTHKDFLHNPYPLF